MPFNYLRNSWLTFQLNGIELIMIKVHINFERIGVFMRNLEKDAKEMSERRENILREGFRLFAEKTIDAVPMIDVAKAAGVGIATLYRYYSVKSDLVLGISTDVWSKYISENYKKMQEFREQDPSASREYEFMLDSFLDLYKNHRDILRYNQFFNVYVQNEKISQEQMKPYFDMINVLKERFHEIYVKGLEDKTLRTEEFPEQTIFSSTMHIMLAAAARYAVGLVYVTEASDPENELLMLKEMLMNKFTVKS